MKSEKDHKYVSQFLIFKLKQDNTFMKSEKDHKYVSQFLIF